MSSVDLLLREAEAHEYFAENADLRMTTGDHAKRAANIRAIAAALREHPKARGVVDDAMVERAMNADAEEFGASIPASRVRRLLTAAQQPVQEGGGVCSKCRGTGEVCTGYIDGTPEMFDCTCPAAAPTSAPVGVEAFDARLRGRAGPFTAREGERYVDADIAQAVLREALTQQPAQAAPGYLTADEREWLDYAIEHMRDDSEPEDLTCADVLEALLQRATPPGDDAAGGGHD